MRSPALAILDAGLAASGTSPIRIVYLGSSSTQGYMASNKRYRYVDLLHAKIQRLFPSTSGAESKVIDSPSASFGTLTTTAGVHGYNAGEAGDTSANYLTGDEIGNVAALQPSMVVHMIGANDYYFGTPVVDYKANLYTVINGINSLLAVPCVHLLVQTFPRMDVTDPAVPMADYGIAMSQIADENPNTVAFFDAGDEFLSLGLPTNDVYDVIYTDNIHMNDTGHALMAELIFRSLQLATPPTKPSRNRVTSDRWTGGNATTINGRTSDASMGGAWAVWFTEVATSYAITSGALVAGSTSSVSNCTLPVTHVDVEVGFKMTARPTGSDSVIALLRKDIAGVSPAYKAVRLLINASGVTAQYRTIDGVTHSLSGTLPFTDGDTLAVRLEGLRYTLLRNGSPYWIGQIPSDAGLIAGNYVGFVRTAAATFQINDYYVDTF